MRNEDAKICSRIAPDNEVDENGLLFFCCRLSGSSEDRTEMIRLVVPESPQQGFCTITTRACKGTIKGSEERISGYDPISLERIVSELSTVIE